MIVIIMDNLMGMVHPYGEVYNGLSRAAHIAHDGLFRHYCYLCFICILYIILLRHQTFLLDNIFDLPLMQH